MPLLIRQVFALDFVAAAWYIAKYCEDKLNGTHNATKDIAELSSDQTRKDLGFEHKTDDLEKLWKNRVSNFAETKWEGLSPSNAHKDLIVFLKYLSLRFVGNWRLVKLERDGMATRVNTKQTPGPKDDHMYLPPYDEEYIFNKTYGKHTPVGQEGKFVKVKRAQQKFNRRDKYGKLVLDKTGQCIKGKGKFVYKNKDGKYLFSPDDVKSDAYYQDDRAFLYKLVKDAVIATLHSGYTHIQKKSIGAHNGEVNHCVEVIAKYDDDVGHLDDPDEKTPYYKLRFVKNDKAGQAYKDHTGNEVKYPVGEYILLGLFPCKFPEEGLKHVEPPKHRAFNHDDAFWANRFPGTTKVDPKRKTGKNKSAKQQNTKRRRRQ